MLLIGRYHVITYINSNKIPSVKLGMIQSIQFTMKFVSPKV